MLRALEFSAPRHQAIELGRARLRIVWDDSLYASIDAPLALFFGAGTLYNRDNHQYLVKAFPVNIRFDDQSVCLACYFPMPFFRSARIQLINPGEAPLDVNWSVRSQPFKDSPARVGYFHATWRDHPSPELGTTWSCSTPGKPKVAAIGRVSSLAPRGFSPTALSSIRLRAIRAFSSMTARRRKGRAPAPRNGAAVEITGAAKT